MRMIINNYYVIREIRNFENDEWKKVSVTEILLTFQK